MTGERKEITYFVDHGKKGDELCKSATFGIVASIVGVKGADSETDCVGYAMTGSLVGSDEAAKWGVIELGLELVVICL